MRVSQTTEGLDVRARVSVSTSSTVVRGCPNHELTPKIARSKVSISVDDKWSKAWSRRCGSLPREGCAAVIVVVIVVVVVVGVVAVVVVVVVVVGSGWGGLDEAATREQ